MASITERIALFAAMPSVSVRTTAKKNACRERIRRMRMNTDTGADEAGYFFLAIGLAAVEYAEDANIAAGQSLKHNRQSPIRRRKADPAS
jgi:hypothetical protein